MVISQEKYINDLLVRYGFDKAKPANTPMIPSPRMCEITGESVQDITMFRSMVGSLQYLSLTRPDISFAVNQICQHLHKPLEGHLQAVKRVFRYLRGISNMGLRFTTNENQNLTLEAYCDSDWGATMDRRFISGSSIWLNGNLVSWSAKKQPSVSLSSAEVEFKAISHVTFEIRWFCLLLWELNLKFSKPPLLLCDNKSAIYMATNPTITQQIKTY